MAETNGDNLLEVRDLVTAFDTDAGQVVAVDGVMVDRAIDTHRQYQISYWDGLIIAAAERAECMTLLSEDLSAGQAYHGLRVENPFALC